VVSIPSHFPVTSQPGLSDRQTLRGTRLVRAPCLWHRNDLL